MNLDSDKAIDLTLKFAATCFFVGIAGIAAWFAAWAVRGALTAAGVVS